MNAKIADNRWIQTFRQVAYHKNLPCISFRGTTYTYCEEKGTDPKPQKVKPKPRTELRAIQPNPGPETFCYKSHKTLQVMESSHALL